MSKLRLLGLLAGAVAAFSVVGFAASFNVAPSPVVNAEGETLVTACDTDITVKKNDVWKNPTEGAVPGAGGFYVQHVQLRDIAAACEGKYFYIALTGPNGQLIAHSPAMQFAGVNLNWFPTESIAISQLRDIHVLMAGDPQWEGDATSSGLWPQ
jgi:hypothetical protein